MTAQKAPAARSHVTPLKRLWPWMLGLAILVHAAFAAWVFALDTAPDIKAGGGGRVLGQISMNLASAPLPDPDPVEEPDSPVEPDPVIEKAPPEPKKPATKPKPVKPKPVKLKKPQPQPKKPQPKKPVQQAPRPAPPVIQPETEAEPAPATRAAAPTRGEGAAAPTVGLGGQQTRTVDNDAAYLADLRARIERQRRYPADARRRGDEGVATAAIVIAPDGSLASVSITGTSGSYSLDRMAKRMVSRAAPFPPPPRAPYRLNLPIVFSLAH
ncbi:TonB family protein [Pyruvatibacter mobilis]|uniref:TonB family protein n=1 Tax=Pyruvatibacter mobilis TaxID=1712261 RepID=UPI003D0C489A